MSEKYLLYFWAPVKNSSINNTHVLSSTESAICIFSMLQRAFQHAPRCSFCGLPLAGTTSNARRSFSISTSYKASAMLSLVPPHQAGRLAVSLRSASLPSPPLRIVSQRRAFATIVQRPSAAFEDLPEPPIEEGKESALDTLNITAAAERVGPYAV